MVVASNPKSWLPDQRFDPTTLGILAFEVAAAMTRLLSLHRTLSDDNILTLRSEPMRSQGVAYLNSTDQAFLFRLACAEIMDDLDRTVAAVIRLGDRCRGLRACGLVRAYADIKSGSGDPRMALRGGAEKITRRMEKYVSSTSRLYDEMEALGELEAEERRLLQRLYGGRDSGPIPLQKPPLLVAATSPDGAVAELKLRRHRVRRLKEESLWGQSFDKAVVLMARASCAILARVCIVFGAFVPGLPPAPPVGGDNGFLRFAPAQLRTRIYPWFPAGKHSSGPLERRRPTREAALRNSCPVIGSAKASEVEAAGTNWGRMLVPPARTVGGSGLAGRYATVVELAERLLQMREDGYAMGAEERRLEAAAREELYELLPAGLRAAVKGKLRDWWRQDAGPLDGSLAEGWREAAGRIMGWLAPMAHDTVAWQAERNMDRRQRFDPRPRMLLLQTLYFSDREKTEAAITEVLVALSLVGWYEERRRPTVRF